MATSNRKSESEVKRRDFIRRSVGIASASFLGVESALSAIPHGAGEEPEAPRQFDRRIKLGIVGCGGRGSWIAQLFAKHGGYELFAVGDYFQDVATCVGEKLSVPRERRFSGLSAYRKVIGCGVEAVALETPPFFIPEHAAVAVQAGLHSYLAKPVAVDVPGSLSIEAAGKRASEKKLCFFVDYQMPTDPMNIEVVKRIHDGVMGQVEYMITTGFCGGFEDPPKSASIEDRLQSLIWVNDIALGCDYIGNYDIHAIDVALWVARQRPIAASGASRICRPNPHGDSHDVCSVVYEFADGLILNHAGEGRGNHPTSILTCQVFGGKGNAQINYWGKAHLRGGARPFRGGEVENLYEAGAVRNIASFYDSIIHGRFANPTVRRSVDGALTTILGREAAERRSRVTMDQLISENKRLEVDLTGLKT